MFSSLTSCLKHRTGINSKWERPRVYFNEVNTELLHLQTLPCHYSSVSSITSTRCEIKGGSKTLQAESREVAVNFQGKLPSFASTTEDLKRLNSIFSCSLLSSRWKMDLKQFLPLPASQVHCVGAPSSVCLFRCTAYCTCLLCWLTLTCCHISGSSRGQFKSLWQVQGEVRNTRGRNETGRKGETVNTCRSCNWIKKNNKTKQIFVDRHQLFQWQWASANARHRS